MPKKSNVRANTMPKNPKNDHNQQENSKSSPTPREISDPANKPQKVSFLYIHLQSTEYTFA